MSLLTAIRTTDEASVPDVLAKVMGLAPTRWRPERTF